MRSRAEKKLAKTKAKDELSAMKAQKRIEKRQSKVLTPEQEEAKKVKDAEKAKGRTARNKAEKAKPIYKRKLFVLCVVLLLLVIIAGIGQAMKPDLKSLTATYTGSTVEGTDLDASKFKAIAKYDNGTKETVDTVTLKNDATLVYGETTTATVIYSYKGEDHTAKVAIKCDKIKTYKASDFDTATTLKTDASSYIEGTLKAPSTAKFHDEAVVDAGTTNVFYVKGTVDAENSFGAMLSNDYIVEIKLGPLSNGEPTYTVLDYSFSEE